MLPPVILQYEHLDTSNMRHMNIDFAPIKHPFDDTGDIESYTISWFEDQLPSHIPTFICFLTCSRGMRLRVRRQPHLRYLCRHGLLHCLRHLPVI